MEINKKKEKREKREKAKRKKRIVDALLGVRGIDKRLKFVKEFEITVPYDFDSGASLSSLRRKYKREFMCFDGNINDLNFKATIDLDHGRKFMVKVFEYVRGMSSSDSLAFLKTQKAILIGPQGIALAYEAAKNELFEGVFISFDKKETLWVDKKNELRIPALEQFKEGKVAFFLEYFNNKIEKGSYLLCFFDVNSQ